MQRRTAGAVALVLAGIAAPTVSGGQSSRANAPGVDTPRLLVVVFASSNKLLGVEVADEIRKRITIASNPRQLYVTPREQMVSFLESSGYKADSALGLTDLKELAKGLRADEVLGGSVSKTAANCKISPRMMMATDPAQSQPLPVIETCSFGDAARQLERSYGEARKQLKDKRDCENHIRAGANEKAILSATLGITKYAPATLARLCLTQALFNMKQYDSSLAVLEKIRSLDPQNSHQYRLAFNVYQAKNDQERAVRSLIALLPLEPGNASLHSQIINELAKLGKPEVAIPIIDTLLHQNPGDPMMLRNKWMLTLQVGANIANTDTVGRIAAFSKAIVAGDEMVKADTAQADSVFYTRQTIAARAVSNQKGAEVAALAVRKYPNNQDFWWLKANAEWKSGQLQAAQVSVRRLLALNPKYESANVLLAQLYLESGTMDSAVAVARRALAAGEDSKTWGNFLLRPAKDAIDKAQALPKDSTGLAAWEQALTLSQEVDKLGPSATSKFFVGISSFSIGYAAVSANSANARLRSCPLAKRAQDMFLITQTTLPMGGSIDPKTAGDILGTYLPQLAPTADEMVKRYCR